MRGPARAVLVAAAALLPLAASGAAGDAAALRALQGQIAQCRARLDPALDVGYERIAARCPELVRRLSRSEWAAWLPPGWRDARNDLSAGSLAELGVALAREAAAAPVRAAPRTESLAPVLAALGEAGTEQGGAWQRFKRWLRALLGARAEDEPDDALGRLLARSPPSQAVLEAVAYAAVAAVVLLAALLVWNELRIAGVGRRHAGVQGGRAAPAPATVAGGAGGWDELDSVPRVERPGRMLELLVERLARARLLPPARALTVAELGRRVALVDAADRERLAGVARVAEDVRFGTQRPSDPEIDVAVDRGRELLSRLESGATAGRDAPAMRAPGEGGP